MTSEEVQEALDAIEKAARDILSARCPKKEFDVAEHDNCPREAFRDGLYTVAEKLVLDFGGNVECGKCES
jgi:hypothetical protein